MSKGGEGGGRKEGGNDAWGRFCCTFTFHSSTTHMLFTLKAVVDLPFKFWVIIIIIIISVIWHDTWQIIDEINEFQCINNKRLVVYFYFEVSALAIFFFLFFGYHSVNHWWTQIWQQKWINKCKKSASSPRALFLHYKVEPVSLYDQKKWMTFILFC